MTPPWRDPGLQAERTSLAWSRTALLVAVNAFLMFRSGLQANAAALIVLSGVFFLAAAWLASIARLRGLGFQGDAIPQAPSRFQVASVSTITLALATTSLAV